MDKGFILALVFAVIVGVFALSNSEIVAIDFIFTKVEISQALVILASALLGALIVFFIGFIRNFRLKQDIKKLRFKIEELEFEKNTLIESQNEYIEEELEEDLNSLENNEEELGH